MQQSPGEAFSQPAPGFQLSVTLERTGQKTSIVLAFPVPRTLGIKVLTKTGLSGGLKPQPVLETVYDKDQACVHTISGSKNEIKILPVTTTVLEFESMISVLQKGERT
ncbi:hypothetical protein EK904_001850 [Melospiza melodia maxima]|nr:hypothetical protein EK904_001850 [Melospiza melodia maxima]